MTPEQSENVTELDNFIANMCESELCIPWGFRVPTRKKTVPVFKGIRDS